MITFEELSQRFPVKDVAPYGACVVVPGAEFDPDWEVALGDQGCHVRFTDLDGRPVTLVQRKDARSNESKGEKLVYAPQKSVGDEKSMESMESKENKESKKQNRGNPRPVMPWLKDTDFWSPEEDDFIIELWNRGLALAEISVEVNKKYPKRLGNSVVARIYQLQRKGKIEKRHKPIIKKVITEKTPPQWRNPERRWKPEEDELLKKLWNEGLRKSEIVSAFAVDFPKRTEIAVIIRLKRLRERGKLSRVQPLAKNSEKEKATKGTKSENDAPIAPDLELALANLTLETKRQIDDLKQATIEVRKRTDELYENLNATFQGLDKRVTALEKALSSHKHAVSGEAMLPMEASS